MIYPSSIVWDLYQPVSPVATDCGDQESSRQKFKAPGNWKFDTYLIYNPSLPTSYFKSFLSRNRNTPLLCVESETALTHPYQHSTTDSSTPTSKDSLRGFDLPHLPVSHAEPKNHKMCFSSSASTSTPVLVSMAVTNPSPPVNHCCGYCCKAEEYGTHDYCGWCEVTDCL